MRPHALALLASAALLLAGCDAARRNPNTVGGGAFGAAAGAAIGTLAGGDDTRNALIGAGLGLLLGATAGQVLDEQQRALERDLAGTGAEVIRRDNELLVRLPSRITFAFDSAAIEPRFRPALEDVARTLAREPRSLIDVVGHTDSVGSEAYNRELSERRAASVAEALVTRGVAPGRIAVVGRGELEPIATNATPEGRQENRRVELRIVPAEPVG